MNELNTGLTGGVYLTTALIKRHNIHDIGNEYKNNLWGNFAFLGGHIFD